MIGEKILEKRPVSLVEVKQLLSERKKAKDLSYELASIQGLNTETIVKIVDILPEKKEILQLLISRDVIVDEAGLKAILDLCKKYRK